MGILEIFQGRPPMGLPLLLRMQNEGLVIEEFWWYILFDRRRLAIAHPHKHQSFECSRRVGARVCPASADVARPGALPEEGLRRAVLVQGQAVIRAGDGARKQAFALGERGVAVRTPVAQGDHIPLRPTKEDEVAAKEGA